MATTQNIMADFVSQRNISFNGGDLSSDTGSILPLDFIFKNKLLDPYQDLTFNDTRTFCKPCNSNFSLLIQCTVRSLLGFDIQADQQILSEDPILRQYFPEVSSQSAVSRFYNRADEKTSNAFAEVFMNQSCDRINRHQKDLIFDADSTKTDI